MLPSGTSSICKTGVFNARAIAKFLRRGYTLEETSHQLYAGVARDTFDGHQREEGMLLVQTKDRLFLINLNSLSIVEQASSSDWKFAQQLDAGDVRFQCLEASVLRAFMPEFEVGVDIQHWSVRDELQKIVVRLKTITVSRASKKATWVFGESLRGFESEGKHVFQGLRKSGYEPFSGDYYPMLGINTPVYNPKPDITIDPVQEIVATANTIVLTFLEVARANERGSVDDTDTEFVHDYRVSLRRIRSLISLFKGVYSDEFTAEIKTKLAYIMRQTNQLRDLDVYLLDRDHYYELVPENMYAGLDIMFGVFEKERIESLAEVQTLFRSSEYGRDMKRIKTRFQSLEKSARGHQASVDSMTFAKKTILKRYRKIAAIAKLIDSTTPDETVHELRIQCKKLRYLMEFFAPLFPPKKIKLMIKSLKGLQDVLGRFNDYSVQQESLSKFVEVHPMRGKKGLKLAESVGALVATLYQLQKKARKEVELKLDEFVNRETADAFEHLFSKG